MPFDGNKWDHKKMVSYQDLLTIIRDKWPDLERLTDEDNDTSKVGKLRLSLYAISLLFRENLLLSRDRFRPFNYVQLYSLI